MSVKLNRSRIIAAIAVTLTYGSMPIATAEDDPFPGVAYQAEIPGTRVSGDIAINCPAGSGRGIEVAIGSGTFTYCIKTWQSTATIDAWATYRSSVDTAQAAALAQSQQWNEANPGKQKCFQWGPFTDPNGGTSSGGVCANPVPVPAGSVVDSGTVVSAPVQESATVNSTPVVTAVLETTTPVVVDTRTVVSDTTTVLVDTPTVVSVDTTTAIAMPIAIMPLATSVLDTTTALVDDLESLPEIVAEEEPSTSIEARIVAGKTRISIVSDFVATKMTVVASKKGSRKKYTYRISTNSNGELIFKSSVNLKGFTLVIYKDGQELDREVV